MRRRRLSRRKAERIVESREDFLAYPQTSPEIYAWLPYSRETAAAPAAAPAAAESMARDFAASDLPASDETSAQPEGRGQ